MNWWLNLAICVAAWGFANASVAAPGELDATFGSGNGKVIFAIGTADDNAHAMAIQPDGKIVVVGACGTTTNRDFCVARSRNTNGRKDCGGRAMRDCGQS